MKKSLLVLSLILALASSALAEVATATLTDADIKALTSTPYQIIAPAGANKLITVTRVIFTKGEWSAGYILSDNSDFFLTYTATFDDGGTGFQFAASVLAQFGDAHSFQYGPHDVQAFNAEQFSVNRGLYLWVPYTSIASSDAGNELKITVFYELVDL